MDAPGRRSAPDAKILISFKLSYDLYLSSKEKAPRLRAWISRNISNDQHEVELGEDLGSQKGTRSISIKLPLNDAWLDSSRREPKVADLERAVQAASLSLAFYCSVDNKLGEACYNQCGDALIPLARLSHQLTSTGMFTGEIVLPTSRAADRRKGAIVIQPADSGLPLVSVTTPRGTVPLRPPSEGEALVLEELAAWRLQVMDRNMGANYQTYVPPRKEIRRMGDMWLKPRWPTIADVNMYAFETKAGVVSAVVYIANKIPEPNVSFYENALQVILGRNNITAERFAGLKIQGPLAQESDVKLACKILAQVLCLYPCYCNYLLDTVYSLSKATSPQTDRTSVPSGSTVNQKLAFFFKDKSPWERDSFDSENVESFDYLRARHIAGEYKDAGDCEDFGAETMIEAMELHLIAIRVDKGLLQVSRALLKLLECRRMHYYAMCLTAVGSPTVDFVYGSDEMSAHMCVMQIPKAKWWTWWTKANGGDHPLEGGTTSEMLLWQEKGETDLEGEVARIEESSRSHYRVMFLEGTGFLFPEPQPEAQEACAVERDMLEKINKLAFEGLRKWHRYSLDPKTGEVFSPFYRAPVKLVTCEMLMRGIPVAMFAMTGGGKEAGVPPPRGSPAWSATYGITFDEIVLDDPHVMLWAEHEFTLDEIAVVKSYVKDLWPLPSLRAPPAPHACARRRHSKEWTARLKQELDSLYNATLSAGAGVADVLSGDTVEMQLFVKYFQMTDERRSALVKAFTDQARRSKGGAATYVDMKVNDEPVQPEIGGVCITFWVRKAAFKGLRSRANA